MAPWLIEDTRVEIGKVRNEIDDLRKQVETAGQCQVEAMVLLTRALDELNLRVARLEPRANPPEG